MSAVLHADATLSIKLEPPKFTYAYILSISEYILSISDRLTLDHVILKWAGHTLLT